MVKIARLHILVGLMFTMLFFISCTPELELYPLYDLSETGYEITQTFGQLIYTDQQKIAHYMILSMPEDAEVKAFTSGTVLYESDFYDLGPCLILTPKKYLVSDTDFENLEGMPRAASIRFVFGNLIESEVETAIQNRYTDPLRNSDPAAAARRFINGHHENREIDVDAKENIQASTILGKADGGELYIAAFKGNPETGEDFEFVNPLPFILAAIPHGSFTIIDDQQPQIRNVAFFASEDPALLSPTIYEVPASNVIEPPNILFKHIQIYAQIEDRAKAASDNICVYEFSYEISRVTRDGENITDRELVSNGRHLVNRIHPDQLPQLFTALYNTERSYTSTRTFWYKLHFNPSMPPLTDPTPQNYTQDNNIEILDISGYPPSEYEFVLKTRDALMPAGTPVTDTIYTRIDNSHEAIASAKWKLKADFGAVSSEVDVNGETAFLIIPGTNAPFNVQTQIQNAPTISTPAAFRYRIETNGHNINPSSNLGLFPTGDNLYTGIGTTLNLNFSEEGVQVLFVWLDQNGDNTYQQSESSRCIVILTYELTPTIIAERKRAPASYSTLAPNTLMPVSDAIKLTLSATGFEMGHNEHATYRWEVATPIGQITQSGTVEEAVWEEDPCTTAGTYTARGIVELFGVEFDTIWTQIVVGANIDNIEAICENENRNVAVTLIPSPLPAGENVDLSIDRPTNLANGNATFTDGTISTTRNTSGNAAIRGVTISNAADNISLVIRFDGVDITQETFSIYGIRFLDENKNEADHLRIALWENAYDPANAFKVKNLAAPADNFIDLDPRRFYVRVINHSKNKDHAALDLDSGEIGITGGITGNVIDDYTQIRLEETGNNTGIFETPSQLLMSPDLPIRDRPDDKFAADDGRNNKVDDDRPNDRTHRTDINGTVNFKYKPDPSVPAQTKVIRVFREAGCDTCGHELQPGTPCKLEIRIWVFNEPYQDAGYGGGNGIFDGQDYDRNGTLAPDESEPFIDVNLDGLWQVGEPFDDIGYNGINRFDFTDINGNGKHDNLEPCESFRDLSSGGVPLPPFSVVGSRGGVDSLRFVQQEIERAEIAWAQAGIQIEQVGITNFVDAPTNALGTNIIQDGLFTYTASNDDELEVVNTYAAGASIDVLEVFYVAKIPSCHGYSDIPDVNRTQLPILGEKTFTFLGSGNTLADRTLAHEIGHALTNRWDPSEYHNPDNPQYIFFPSDADIEDNDYNSYRRLLRVTAETNARTDRHASAPGNLSATGNRLLKDP